MTATQSTNASPTRPWRPSWAVLAICCMAQFMVVLDVSIVNVALPQMRHSLGLSVTGHGEVVCHWRYAGIDDAVKALLCSAGGARAIEAAGPDAVRDVLQRALARFHDPRTGVVTLANTFRWVAACRAS